MINDTTKEILLTQIIKREELTRLAKDFEVLKEAYIELAMDTLSADERKYYDLVMNGIFGKENINKYLYFQKDIDLQGFFQGCAYPESLDIIVVLGTTLKKTMKE